MLHLYFFSFILNAFFLYLFPYFFLLYVSVTVVAVVLVVVMCLPTGCIQEAGEGTSPILSFLHSSAMI